MARAGEAKLWVTAGSNLDKVCEWVASGLTDKQLANNIGISESTLYEWKKKYPEFTTALSEAKQKPKLELENAMYKLATGQMFIEKTKTVLDPQGQKVIKVDKVREQLAPNAQIQMFLARAWMPEKYREERADNIEELLNE